MWQKEVRGGLLCLRGQQRSLRLMNRAEGMCLRETREDFHGVRVFRWSKACEFKAEKEERSGWCMAGAVGRG